MSNGPKADLSLLRSPWDYGTLAGLDDRALLARFVEDGSELAFEGLVRRHGPMVLRVCSGLLGDRHAAEDAFQAVFLVLARRAGSIRRPERLAPWLHGVALRTAGESRKREARRRRIERRGATMPGMSPNPPERPLIRLEEAETLHREVARLPERYRGPVVLCDLEGLTHQEAAAQLRCPVGTVTTRLKRARERLRDRLTRRGIDPTAGLMAATLGPTAPVSVLSPALIEATVRAATTAGLASASAVSLAQGVQMTMTIARGKIITAGATLALGLAVTWSLAAGPQVPAKPGDDPPPPIPARTIERAALREVRDFEIYAGQAEPSRMQDIRARVGGYLEKAFVEDGARVKANDLLFEIDPKPYLATVDLAVARLAKAAAQKQLARTVMARNARLKAKNKDLVSEEDAEKAEAEFLFSDQGVAEAKQAETQARADLEATRIRAPFDGEINRQISRLVEVAQAGHTSVSSSRAVELGGLIKAHESVLARLVATDPIVVYFNVAESRILKLRRLHGDDRAKADGDLAVRLALLDDQDFSLKARLEAIPDRLDPISGTGRFRATVPNPDHRILPGMSVRVRMSTGPSRQALVVPASAIREVEGRATVYAVDDHDVIRERTIQPGLSLGEVREVRDGLQPGDRVLAGDLKGVQPGTPLKP